METPFKIGDKVLVNPQVTDTNDWLEGIIINIEKNPFAGIVITVEIDGESFFEKEDMFKPIEKRGMYAIVFDMSISDLKENYSPKYHSAYTEIKDILKKSGFSWIQGSTYASQGDLKNVYTAINSLNKINWFRKSVRDIYPYV